MGDGYYREIVIRHGAQTITGYLSDRIRNRRPAAPPATSAEPDRPALAAAEALIGRRASLEGPDAVTELEAGPALVPEDLFDGIEDREEAKLALRGALESSKPVHILLVGDPGCGKTELLRCIAKMPASRYAVGGATTSSGLIGYLLERPSTRNVVIDELDKADKADLYALYSLMQGEIVTRLQHEAHEEVRRRVWIFAGANRADQLPEALLSRFVRIQLPTYTPDQMRAITAAILEKQEGASPARAREIAAAITARGSHDPRDGIQIARLAGPEAPIGPVVEQVIPRTIRKSGVS